MRAGWRRRSTRLPDVCVLAHAHQSYLLPPFGRRPAELGLEPEARSLKPGAGCQPRSGELNYAGLLHWDMSALRASAVVLMLVGLQLQAAPPQASIDLDALARSVHA